MKAIVQSFVLVFTITAVAASANTYAKGGNDLPSAPKVKNYHEVVSKFKLPKKCRKHADDMNVTMRFLVSETGEVLKVQAQEAGSEQLKEACLKHMRGFEFEPARNADGEPMAIWVKMPIRFDLR